MSWKDVRRVKLARYLSVGRSSSVFRQRCQEIRAVLYYLSAYTPTFSSSLDSISWQEREGVSGNRARYGDDANEI